MQTNRNTSALVLAGALLFGSSSGLAQQQGQPQGKPSSAQVEQVIKDWKDQPRKVARDIMKKYGPPHEVTPQRLVWHNTGPWKRTELINEEIDHNFPLPHKDMLYQVVNFDVPADKFDEIAAFDGSVIIDRTRGELGARCDKEPANFLAVNLAYEIATGKRSVEDARKTYAEQIIAMANNKPTKLMQGLIFEPPRTAGYADEQLIEPSVAQQVKEKMKSMGAARQ